MHGLRSSSAASPHQDGRTKRARTAGDALRAELALEEGTDFEYEVHLYDPHTYDGERCIFCNVNIYDDGIYGPFECVQREGYIYTTETR
jgi:hypothetical protein